jgi:uncharacterized protein (TIGR02145 family)
MKITESLQLRGGCYSTIISLKTNKMKKSLKQCFVILIYLSSIFIGCQKSETSKSSSLGSVANQCTGSIVNDIDGNIYNVVTIGNQCWMKENLKVKKYSNGDLIPTNLSNSAWSITTFGAFDSIGNYQNYEVGNVYNWYAVADPRGLCPTGFHVPTTEDINQLIKYTDITADTFALVGNYISQNAGYGLKDTTSYLTNSSGWVAGFCNFGANNWTRFSALKAAQYKGHQGNNAAGGAYDWWTSDYSGISKGIAFNIGCGQNTWNNYAIMSEWNTHSGIRVRCIKD